jgi:sugar lactone lactonase YvrE
MAYVSSLAFGPGNLFSSCQESRDEWNVGPQTPDDFMGPTLWSADLDVFAAVNQAFPPDPLEGSHLDMLHQSPLCMGIAHDVDNVYWAFDGGNGHIVRYDFMADHGPGGSSHVDGVIRRYLNAVVTREAEIPGHLVLDRDSGMLYIADTGTGRVMRLDTASGASNGDLPNNWDGATEYTGWDGATFEAVVEGLGQPSGIELVDGRLFVTDHASAEILAYDLDGNELGRLATGATGLMGITVGPDGKLYYADGFGNEIVRVDP